MNRRCGILLHPSSLPDGFCNGELGQGAYRFVDFLADAGQTLWQTLPLGPTHADGSPYQSLSAHAGNPLLISTQWLVEKGWLQAAERNSPSRPTSFQGYINERRSLLGLAYQHFLNHASTLEQQQFKQFKFEQAHWLDNYAYYLALKTKYNQASWTHWPLSYRTKSSAALAELSHQFAERIAWAQFEQFVFFSQWLELKAYANKKNIRLVGDLPIFVSHDSVDVWAYQDCFLLDKQGNPTVVAGVPPDYFSETGQLWGNPHYHWEYLREQGYDWWLQRLQTQLALFDIVRIDHFRGFEAFWEVPIDHETAMKGQWVEGPGASFFTALQQHFGEELPLIAEDLGVITPAVDQLRDAFNLPGMKVLQFAFGGDANNPYLPHHHIPNSVVYTGTHDNDTTVGWYASLSEQAQQQVKDYLGFEQEAMPWPLIRCAMSSVCRYAILPFQDILSLDSEHRMNVPGTSTGNWAWRFSWQQIPEGLSQKLREHVDRYDRYPPRLDDSDITN